MLFFFFFFEIRSNQDPCMETHVKLRKIDDITSVKSNNINDVTCSILLIAQNLLLCLIKYQIKLLCLGLFSLD